MILFTVGERSASVLAGMPPPPGAEHAGRYGQRAGGMHPTGMQSHWFGCEVLVICCALFRDS